MVLQSLPQNHKWTIDGSIVTNGDLVSCTALLQDGSNAVIISTDSVTENSAPTIDVSFAETDLYSDSLATCEAVPLSDIEGHDVTLSYRFYKLNGSEEVVLGEESTLQLSPENIQPSDTLYCSCYCNR